MQRDPSKRPKAEIVAATVAVGSIGGLAMLTLTGILTSLPLWLATLIVVVELLAPLLVYRILKRAENRR